MTTSNGITALRDRSLAAPAHVGRDDWRPTNPSMSRLLTTAGFVAVVVGGVLWLVTGNEVAAWIVFGLTAVDLLLAVSIDQRRRSDTAEDP